METMEMVNVHENDVKSEDNNDNEIYETITKGDTVLSLSIMKDDMKELTLEDLENELDSICRKQAELDNRKEELLEKIEEVKTSLRNDFYAKFYNEVLRLFEIYNAINECTNEKQFDEYLTVLIDMISDYKHGLDVKPVSDGKILLTDNKYWDTRKPPYSVFIEDKEYFLSSWNDFVMQICRILNEKSNTVFEQVSDMEGIRIINFDHENQFCNNKAYTQVSDSIYIYLPVNQSHQLTMQYVLMMVKEFDKLAGTDYADTICYKLVPDSDLFSFKDYGVNNL